MSSESKLVVELWDYLKDMLPKSGKTDTAVHILRLFQEYGIELDKDELEGECDILDQAVEIIFGDEDDHDDADDADWDYERDDD